MLNASSKSGKSEKSADVSQVLYSWSTAAAILLVLAIFVVLPILSQMSVSLVPFVWGWDTVRTEQWLEGPTGTFFNVLTAESLITGALVWFLRRKKRPFLKIVGLTRLRWRDPGYALLGAMVYLGLFVVVLTAVNAIVPIDTGQEQAIGFQKGIGGIDLVLAFISLAILPPLVEETVFRGFLFGTLRARKVSLVAAMLSTSIFFGALHLLGGSDGSLLWIAFIDTFVLSMVLCYIREITGSIWGCIFLHALKNTLVFINLFIIGTT